MSFLTTLVFVVLASAALGTNCKYIQAQSGDGCWSLSKRCNITQLQLKKYNPKSNFCSALEVGDYVCCSAGSIPDFSPKPYANGTCHTYAVQPGDTCSAIAKANQMDAAEILTYNNRTWGFAGCSDLQADQKICLSRGTPPFPSMLAGATCGPQVPGTKRPSNMDPSYWMEINPCPLHACCNIWGQCGITPEFCTQSFAATGAPGTAKRGTNGCISNCGTSIMNHDAEPSLRMRIAYFETWNIQRKCLFMDISELQGNSYYTHVHWAFANVTKDWKPDISGVEDQFDGLLKLAGLKKVLSFGGWGFSTSNYTFNVFRNGVKNGNRQVFAKNVVDFVIKNNLDGIDFDWEFPGAQDIPGIPPDSHDSGENYLAFLKLVRSRLPSDKTLSIAAPASFWYLKGFPIREIGEVVDYIVYMTYDMHGQWDYGTKYADPGCPSGGCLRSQVNKTETEYALAMITKAGVLSKKIIVGLPLYGRSFQMSNSSCTGEMCHFTGPSSGAKPGICTNVAGYISNYEIYSIISAVQHPALYGKTTIQQYHQKEGDVLIYDGDNYVSWLNPSSYASRRRWYDSLNFGGTSDWAVDLNETYTDNGKGNLIPSGFDSDNFQSCDYSKTFDSLDDLQAASGGLQSDCIAAYTLQVLITMLDKAYANYTNVNNGYDGLFGAYVTYMKNLVPVILEDNFIWNISTPSSYPTSVPKIGSGMTYFDCKMSGSDETLPCEHFEKFSSQLVFGTVDMILKDDRGYQGGLADAGLSPDWVDFGNYEYVYYMMGMRGYDRYALMFAHAPVRNDSMVVPNPKDIVTKGIGNIADLRTQMQATLLDIMLGQWFNGLVADAAQAYSTPVFTLLQAIDAMAQAKKLGEKEEEIQEEERKNIIILIVSAVLFFVPFIGEEAASAAGFASLARAIAMGGEVSNGALAIYDTVNDPSAAVVNILGMLFGVGVIAKVARDGTGLAKVAKVRASMKSDEVASLGPIFRANDDKLQSLMKVCRV